MNNNKGGPLCNAKLRQAVIDLRDEMDVEHESNIRNITCDDLYQSPMKNIDVSTINDSIYYESDEQVDTISNSRKQVDPRNYLIKQTQIIDGVCTLSIGVGPLKPAVIGTIGNDSTDLVTHVLTNSSEQLSMKSSFPLNMNQPKAFVIGSQCKSVGGNRNTI